MQKENPSTTLNQTAFDAVIVGGGPVGMLMALLMIQRNFRVALIDRLSYDTVLQENYDGRTFAYAYGSKLIFERANIWQHLEPHAEPIWDIFVSAQGPGSDLHYHAKDMANHPMGYNIETRHFRSVVYQVLKDNPLFHLFAPCDIEQIDFQPTQVHVSLTGQKDPLTAPLLLAADGKNSQIRQQLGIKSKKFPYHQQALVLVVEHEKPHQGCAYEHFLETGPLAFLPMRDAAGHNHRSGVIWSLREDLAPTYHTLSNEVLASELEQHFKKIFGPIRVVGERWLFPLEVGIIKNYVAPRVALIGDAAHAIHPVAGQGFNLGIRDTEALADHLAQMRAVGMDLGSLGHLETYERSRRADVLSMTAMCDGLVRLFSNDIKTLGHVRRAGLALTNHIRPLKRLLTRHAMGL